MANQASKSEGIADYLRQFDRSPYRLPATELRRVDGVSTLKGSWRRGTERSGIGGGSAI